MRRVLFLTICLLLMSITGQAQRGCNIDLEDELLMLIRAQRAADSGKDAEAVALLEALQTEFATISERCGNASILLPNEFTLPDESLSFRYPDQWIIDEFEENVWIVTTEQSLLDELNGDTPNFRSGDYLVGIFLEEVDTADSFADAIDDLENDFDFGGVISRPQEIMIGDIPAVQAIYATPVDLPFVVTFLDFTDSEENEPAVVMLVGIGVSEDVAVLKTYTDVIASSVEYPAVASLREAGTPLTDLTYSSDPIALGDLNDELDGRFVAVISPDGTKIASMSDEFCVYTLDSGAISCQELENRVSPPALYWSPDSRFVAFHENFVRTFRDSDLFLYDDLDGSITKLTDGDDDDMDLFGSDEPYIFDGTMTWGLDNQIYMLRFASDGSGGIDAMHTPLVRINPETGAIEELADFSADFPPFAVIEYSLFLDGIMSVSPDLSQIALIARAPSSDDESINGVWVYNLQTESLTQIATMTDLSQGLPDDHVPFDSRLPLALGWDNASQGVFVFVENFAWGSDFSGLYYVDVLNSTTLPITDYSDNTMDDLISEDDELSLVYDLVRAPVIAPNVDGFIYINHQLSTIGLSALPFENGTGGEVTPLMMLPEDIPIRPIMASSVSRDGKLLIYGLLFLPD